MIFEVLLTALALVSAAELLLYYTHMYQLNSYMAIRQMRWVRANAAFGLVMRILIPLAVCGDTCAVSGRNIRLFRLCGGGSCAFADCTLLPEEGEKPLVFTNPCDSPFGDAGYSICTCVGGCRDIYSA